jgi:hypothetical protein
MRCTLRRRDSRLFEKHFIAKDSPLVSDRANTTSPNAPLPRVHNMSYSFMCKRPSLTKDLTCDIIGGPLDGALSAALPGYGSDIAFHANVPNYRTFRIQYSVQDKVETLLRYDRDFYLPQVGFKCERRATAVNRTKEYVVGDCIVIMRWYRFRVIRAGLVGRSNNGRT